MPKIEVLFYCDEHGAAPVLAWLEELRLKDQQAYERCTAAIGRLADCGHELRRPLADTLRDGVHELRIRKGHVNYRILYFFHGRNVAVLAHALTKEAGVPRLEIERAVRRMKVYIADPAVHTYSE